MRKIVPAKPFAIIGTQVSARLVRRTGQQVLLLAAPLIIAAGMLWFAQLPSHGSYLAHFFGPSVVTMLGFGMAFVPLTMAGMAGVPPDRAGIASGVFNTSRQVGGAIGLAALVVTRDARLRLVKAMVLLAVLTAIVIALLAAPGLGGVRRKLAHANLLWVSLAAAAELGSCVTPTVV